MRRQGANDMTVCALRAARRHRESAVIMRDSGYGMTQDNIPAMVFYELRRRLGKQCREVMAGDEHVAACRGAVQPVTQYVEKDARGGLLDRGIERAHA